MRVCHVGCGGLGGDCNGIVGEGKKGDEGMG